MSLLKNKQIKKMINEVDILGKVVDIQKEQIKLLEDKMNLNRELEKTHSDIIKAEGRFLEDMVTLEELDEDTNPNTPDIFPSDPDDGSWKGR